MKTFAPVIAKSNFQHGFNLIELAIVLMIIGTLMSGVLVAVSQSTANARITQVKAQLREVEEAIYGFAQTYGRLPCPATNVSDGYENCAITWGFVPAATLDLAGQINDDGLLVDAWANPLRYSLVITAGAGNPNYSDKASIQTFFNAGTTLTSTNMLSVCSESACPGGTILATTVPAVVLSMGANWTSYTSTDELMNAGDQMMGSYPIKDDLTFVSAGYSEENFDDQLVWLSPYVLVNRIVSAGKLP